MSNNCERNFVFVSDLHLSEGFLPDKNHYHKNEDFYFDDAFGRFLAYLQGRRKRKGRGGFEYPWRLVIVGDFLENLQITTLPRVPEKKDNREPAPGKDDAVDDADELANFLRNVQTVIYPEEEGRPDVPATELSKSEKKYGLGFDAPKSVWKLARIMDGHPDFFDALAEFLAAGNELVIVKGNHDPEFTYPELRRYFTDRLNRIAQREHGVDVAGRIFFSPWFYYEPGLFYAEHGGQYDEANRYAFFLDPTMTYEKSGVRTIRFPLFGSSFVRYFFNKIERGVPFADNVRPQTKALWWIVTRKPGFAILKLPKLFGCLWKFFDRKLFRGFDLLALREKYKSAGFSGFPFFAAFSVAGLFLVRPEHRVDYRANKINNVREMNRLAKTDGVPWRDGGGTASDLPLRELLRIYYNSFGDNSVDDAGIDDVQRALARKEGEFDREEEKTLDTVITNIRAAAKTKPRLSSFIVKWLDFIVLAAQTAAFVLTCLYYHQIPVEAVLTYIVIAGLSFFFLHDLKGALMTELFDAELDRYLNKAAAGVARLLGPERVRFIIFGHTHVAYARPIEKDEGQPERGRKQWELNAGSWTPVFDERMMLRQNGDEFPFIQIVTERERGEPEFKLNRWNDELGQPQRIRFAGED